MRLLLGLRVAFIFLFSMVMFLGAVQPARAQILDWSRGEGGDACVQEVTLQDGTAGTPVNVEVATIQGIGCLVRNVLAVATTFIGLAAFVMLVMGAFLYLTSGGQDKHIANAKQAITYAIMGLVVALMAFFILNLIATFTGAQGILRFDIFVEEGSSTSNGSGGNNSGGQQTAAAKCQAQKATLLCLPTTAAKVCDPVTGQAYCQGGETWPSLQPGQSCPADDHVTSCRCFESGATTPYITVSRGVTCPEPSRDRLAACLSDVQNVQCPNNGDLFCSGTVATCLRGGEKRLLSSGQACPTYLVAAAGDYCECRSNGSRREAGDPEQCP